MHYLRELLYNRSVINNIHTDKYNMYILKRRKFIMMV